MDSAPVAVDVVVEQVGLSTEYETPWGFNYELLTDIDPNRQAYIRSMARNNASYIKEEIVSTANSALKIGQRLLEAKEYLPHGYFQKWCEIEFGWNYHKARRFMNIAARFADQPGVFEMGLGNRVLALLAEPRCSDEVIEEVIDLRKQGKKVSKRNVEDLLKTKSCPGATFQDDSQPPTPLPLITPQVLSPVSKLPTANNVPTSPEPVRHPVDPANAPRAVLDKMDAAERESREQAHNLINAIGADSAKAVARMILQILED